MTHNSKNTRKFFPYAQHNFTLVLIIVNIAVFFLSYMMPRLPIFLAISPVGFFGYKFYWTALTYMFVHGSFSHILFNMIFLFFVGPSIEKKMGSWEFLSYYLLTGILAGLFSMIAYLFAGQGSPILGASGAIYALLLAFATYFPQQRILLYFFLSIRAPIAVLLFAAIDLISHFSRSGGGVAHLTHLSGLAFGYLYLIIRMRIDPIRAMRGRH